MKTLNVVAAVIREGERILATQRGYGEHEAARWLSYNEFDSVDWLPADRIVVSKLKE